MTRDKKDLLLISKTAGIQRKKQYVLAVSISRMSVARGQTAITIVGIRIIELLQVELDAIVLFNCL